MLDENPNKLKQHVFTQSRIETKLINNNIRILELIERERVP